jgi:hypothetical protein
MPAALAPPDAALRDALAATADFDPIDVLAALPFFCPDNFAELFDFTVDLATGAVIRARLVFACSMVAFAIPADCEETLAAADCPLV